MVTNFGSIETKLESLFKYSFDIRKYNIDNKKNSLKIKYVIFFNVSIYSNNDIADFLFFHYCLLIFPLIKIKKVNKTKIKDNFYYS